MQLKFWVAGIVSLTCLLVGLAWYIRTGQGERTHAATPEVQATGTTERPLVASTSSSERNGVTPPTVAAEAWGGIQLSVRLEDGTGRERVDADGWLRLAWRTAHDSGHCTLPIRAGRASLLAQHVGQSRPHHVVIEAASALERSCRPRNALIAVDLPVQTVHLQFAPHTLLQVKSSSLGVDLNDVSVWEPSVESQATLAQQEASQSSWAVPPPDARRMIEGASSPLALPLRPGCRTYWVQAPGYAARRIVVDHAHAATACVELPHASLVQLRLVAPDDGQTRRLLVSYDWTDPADEAWSEPMQAGGERRLRVDDEQLTEVALPAGSYCAQVAILRDGRWMPDPASKSRFRLEPLETRQVVVVATASADAVACSAEASMSFLPTPELAQVKRVWVRHARAPHQALATVVRPADPDGIPMPWRATFGPLTCDDYEVVIEPFQWIVPLRVSSTDAVDYPLELPQAKGVRLRFQAPPEGAAPTAARLAAAAWSPAGQNAFTALQLQADGSAMLPHHHEAVDLVLWWIDQQTGQAQPLADEQTVRLPMVDHVIHVPLHRRPQVRVTLLAEGLPSCMLPSWWTAITVKDATGRPVPVRWTTNGHGDSAHASSASCHLPEPGKYELHPPVDEYGHHWPVISLEVINEHTSTVTWLRKLGCQH